MKPRDRKALVSGLLTVFAAWTLIRGVPAAVRAVSALRGKTVGQVETLARVEDVLMRAPAAHDSLAVTFHAIVALAPDLVQGEGPADAQASLSALISMAAGRHSLKLIRVDPLPDSAVGPFQRVSLRAELEGDVGGVTSLLSTLESGEPILTVSALSLDTPDPLGHPRTSEALHLSVDVAGLYLPRAK